MSETEPVSRLLSYWNSVPVALSLLALVAGASVWAIVWPPLPGVAVAILGAAGAVMSLRPDMKPWEKAAWCAIVGSLLTAEIRAIRKDRKETNQQALDDRRAQDLKFKGIRDVQDADFKGTAEDLTAAIVGIKTTLETANRTLLQTQPHAAVRFVSFEFSPPAPTNLEANKAYDFNYHYANGGQETARAVTSLVRAYVGKADDRETQIRLAKQFNLEWKSGAQGGYRGDLVPDYPTFNTLNRTFSPQEREEIYQGGTIYYLLRFEWSDETGRWRTDACGSFQRYSPSEFDLNVFHPCFVFQRFRYLVRGPMKRTKPLQTNK